MIAPAQETPPQPPALAPTVLLIDDRGFCTLEIPDSDGRVISYTLERDWARPGVAVVVRRIDGEAGPYVVWRRPGRLWTCDCEAHRFKSGPYAQYGCKHTRAVRAILNQSHRLLNQPQEKP